MSAHVESEECECGPKVVAIQGQQIVVHRPLPGDGDDFKRAKIFGLPEGWVIKGRRPGSPVLTQAQRDKEEQELRAVENSRGRALRGER